MSDDQASRHLIPITGLVVPADWRVGRVTIHPGSRVDDLLGKYPPHPEAKPYMRAHVEEIVRSATASSIAEVPESDGIESAIDEVDLALHALRLFQLSRLMTHATTFGLPGTVTWSHVPFVSVWEPYSLPGFRNTGDTLGWTFTSKDLEDWTASPAFAFVSEALANPSATVAADRVARGVMLFGRASLEHQPYLKMIGLMSTLEALLLNRERNAQTFRLARYVTWFGCGAVHHDLCGRARQICPYLYLRPGDKGDRQLLPKLQELGQTYAAWRCSEWHQVVEWYEGRGDAAHGRPLDVDRELVDSAEYWISHVLATPILLWLREHPDDPSGDLERAINAVPVPANSALWRKAIGERSPSPPLA